MLVGSCLRDMASARIPQSPERAASVPSAAFAAVDCLLIAANSLDAMAVVYPISEFPIDLLDVAVILLSSRNSAKIRLQADETHSFCSLSGSDCFVALANVSDFAFATSGLCFGG